MSMASSTLASPLAKDASSRIRSTYGFKLDIPRWPRGDLNAVLPRALAVDDKYILHPTGHCGGLINATIPPETSTTCSGSFDVTPLCSHGSYDLARISPS